ncbi:putative two-component response regulator [Gordonia hirsuta DSM 44140 = NBRC 16056]|uniref:Putative two-component response regulator n=1 Tax=Gordonia hirsuta DSM 44140 = NBRC 16056 TaxID=1121927 RepID=L7L8C8_9ACTN|nr:LytTR family DNA-binding domain-containing protein [Gordonia hirsuta]GAC56976.1 putative two-component response regulator [Gordonia hirsuta DSM 44140 = NBRC 16056]
MSADLLRVLAVDDEAPALDELVYLLGEHRAVGDVVAAGDATEALRLLSEQAVDAAFLDISMPGLTGMELAAVLTRYASPPALVFVTAHDDRAVDAFDVGAVDYVLKPLRAERLAQAIERVLAARGAVSPPPEETAHAAEIGAAEVIPVERGGVTSLIRRDSISWVEAVGDYARLHSDSGSYLVRVTLSTLESHWAAAGFARVHRSYLVALPMVTGLRSAGTATKVLVRANGQTPEVELPVSRRQVRELKDRLVRDPLRSFRSARTD